MVGAADFDRAELRPDGLWVHYQGLYNGDQPGWEHWTTTYQDSRERIAQLRELGVPVKEVAS